MRRFLFLLACLLAGFQLGPVAAQIFTVKPQIATPNVPAPQQSDAAGPQFDPALDPDRARAEIARLKAANRQLRQAFGTTLADLQALRARLDETTRPGGSLVTARCVSSLMSQNTAGASEDCSASGYACAAVSGLCHRTCNTSNMCAPGFACNMDNHRCELPPPAADD